MTISPALSTSLTAIGTIMRAAHDPWWIITSAAVALHGADPGAVADVDVLLSVADAERILPTMGVELRHGSAHAAFRSRIFGTWTSAPLPVEFMADFRYRSGAEWVPLHPATRQSVDVGGVTVFIPEAADLIAMLTAFGRPKDRERIRSLAALT